MRFCEALGEPFGKWFVRALHDVQAAEQAGAVALPAPAKFVDHETRHVSPPTDLNPSTQYWRGTSGRLYRHSVHTTIFCPAPQRGVYLLARRDENGRLVPLFVGAAASVAATLNLAHIRRRAARMGATEVHLCPQNAQGSVFALRRAVRDLRQSVRAA